MPAITEIVQQKIQRGQALLPVYNLISLLSALYDQRTDIIIFGGEAVNVVNELGYFFIRPRKGALIQRYDIVVSRKNGLPVAVYNMQRFDRLPRIFRVHRHTPISFLSESYSVFQPSAPAQSFALFTAIRRSEISRLLRAVAILKNIGILFVRYVSSVSPTA